MKGALVGFGRVAQNAHAPALRESPRFAITAATDQSPARLKAAQDCFPGIRTYPTYEALLAAELDLDFVDIATPPFLHGAQVLAALRRGCHVLCEKPLTLNSEEFESIRRQAAAARRTVFTVHNWAYSPQWHKIFECVKTGALGRIVDVDLRVLRTAPAAGVTAGDWRQDIRMAGGGILVDHGWHNLYLIHRLMGDTAHAPELKKLHQSRPGVEDEISLSFKFPSGQAELFLTWRACSRSNWALIRGKRASLELRDNTVLLSPAEGPARIFTFPEKLSAGSAHPQWFKAMLADFPKDAENNLAEASFCLRAISQAYENMATPVAGRS
ncbi:MAG: hypothetical protein A3J74_05125 [Elusimicrobia bacterium RIFCSPHIGHO2_02_FULL_57_9]|nr:MAG: hypothetical protein A3J74_05125 [Elusimicrobia bacterium RIFCSPHIGHO2_02_FULL_57_9]